MPEILTRAKVYTGTTEFTAAASKTTLWLDINGRGRIKYLIMNWDDGTLSPVFEIDGFEPFTLPEVDSLNTNNVEADNGFYWAHDVTGGEEGFTLSDIPFQKRLKISFRNSKTSAVATQFYILYLEIEVGTNVQMIGYKNPFKKEGE